MRVTSRLLNKVRRFASSSLSPILYFFFSFYREATMDYHVCLQFRLESILAKIMRFCPKRHPTSFASSSCQPDLFSRLLSSTHYIKSASMLVPTFDANAKCFGGGWFKAVRWHESRDCAGGCFSVTCPRRISLGFATTLEEESRVNSRDGTRRPFSCVFAESRQP